MSGNLQLTGRTATLANRMLNNVCRILDGNGIPYVLEGGTLLGIVREQRLLPWDNDVDITITDEHLQKLVRIQHLFWLRGYRIRVRRSVKELPHFPAGSVRLVKVKTRRLYVFKGLDLMDVFVKKKVNDRYYWSVGVVSPVLKSAPADFYEKLTRFEYNGYRYSVPRDYEQYLTYRYGDWKVPVKEYDFRKDDLAIEK